jgi:hypothetical protein
MSSKWGWKLPKHGDIALNCWFLLTKTYFFVNISQTTLTTGFWPFILVLRWLLKLWVSTGRFTLGSFTDELNCWAWGDKESYHQLFEVAQGLDQLLPNRLFHFKSWQSFSGLQLKLAMTLQFDCFIYKPTGTRAWKSCTGQNLITVPKRLITWTDAFCFWFPQKSRYWPYVYCPLKKAKPLDTKITTVMVNLNYHPSVS